MKVKGINKSGVSRGEVIELSQDEKVLPALKGAATMHEPWGMFSVWVSDNKVNKISSTVKGDKLKRKWQNNHYFVEGSATFNFRNKEKDEIYPPKMHTYVMQFEDTTDHIGQPDLKVTKFEVK
jgi:hypothetical protein